MSDRSEGGPRRDAASPRPTRRGLLRGALGIGVAATIPAARGTSGAATGGGRTLEPVRYGLRLARQTIAPTGRPQEATVVGGALPATEIRLREGFLLQVDVRNGLDEPTALHWHGLPVANPMDGEVGVTQPAIGPGAVATYQFPAAEPGTYWYHSTVGYQRLLGAAGALVIEERRDPYGVQRDVVVFLSDWQLGDPALLVPGGRGAAAARSDPRRARFVHPGPDGEPFSTDVQFPAFLLNGRSHRNAWTCEAKPGDRLRLRVINGSAQTFFRFAIAGHRLDVVAADGHAVVPVSVDDLVLGNGERYDVVVTVGDPGAYAIRAAALGQSGGAVGVLHTPDAKPVISTARPKWGGTTLRYDMLRAATPRALPAGPRRNLRLSISRDADAYAFSVNGVRFPVEVTCETAFDAIPVQPGEIVGLEIHNETDLAQALHLHGHVFRLLGAGPAETAPRKDTLWVAPGKRSRIEFAATNPGRWLLDGVGLFRRRAGLARVIAYVEGTATR